MHGKDKTSVRQLQLVSFSVSRESVKAWERVEMLLDCSMGNPVVAQTGVDCDCAVPAVVLVLVRNQY